MFEHIEHPYTLQLAALWLSFLPGIGIAGLIAGAQLERIKRAPHKRAPQRRFLSGKPYPCPPHA